MVKDSLGDEAYKQVINHVTTKYPELHENLNDPYRMMLPSKVIHSLIQKFVDNVSGTAKMYLCSYIFILEC